MDLGAPQVRGGSHTLTVRAHWVHLRSDLLSLDAASPVGTAVRASAELVSPYAVVAETDRATLEVTVAHHALTGITVVTSVRHGARERQEPVFLGNVLHVFVCDVPHEPRAATLHSALRTLAMASDGAHAITLNVAGQEIPLPVPFVLAHKRVTLGSQGTRVAVRVALWPANETQCVHAGCAYMCVFNGSRNVTRMAEPALLCAVKDGLASGRAAILLRLGERVNEQDHLAGEWLQTQSADKMPPWSATHELRVLVSLSSGNGSDEADGTRFSPAKWQTLCSRTAVRASSHIARLLEEQCVLQRKQSRHDHIRNVVAVECGALVDEWLTEAGEGSFRQRCLDIIEAHQQSSSHGVRAQTVRDWVTMRLVAQFGAE